MSAIVVVVLVAIACLLLSTAAAFAQLSWPKLLNKYWRIFQLSQQFPGPPTWPLIGNAHLLLRLQPWQLLQMLLQLLRRYGDTMRLWIGPDFVVFLSAPRDVEAVLGSTALLEKASEYGTLRAWLNEGLLLSTGQKWHGRRKLLTPAFHFRILEQFVETFERQSRIFVECLRADAMRCRGGGGDGTIGEEDDWVDMGHRINLLALDIICESAMGVSVNAQTKHNSEYMLAVKQITHVLYRRLSGVLYRFDCLYKFTSLAREEKKALAILHGFTESIIEQRRADLLKPQAAIGNSQFAQEADIGAKRKMNFLDILLQSQVDGKPLSNSDIREEVDTFMFEGHDTTSSAITFFFYNIARYPECQRKCHAEIVAVFGTNQQSAKPAITIEQLNKLHYVELCIKETLRLFPSVPILARKVTADISINGKIIPAGASVAISALHIGRLPAYYPEPHLFRPERFDVSVERTNLYAYIPFSAGPRNCIGQKFAMLEMKCAIAHVLRHFEVEYAGNPNEEPLLIAPLILSTRDPIRFRLKVRVN